MTRDRRASSAEFVAAIHYLAAIAGVGAAVLGTAVIQPWIAPSLSLLFFPAVVIPASYWGRGPALLATLLSTAALAYFFVPPRYSFNIGIDDAIRLTVFVAVALITGSISSARQRAEEALRRSLNDLQSIHDTLQQVRKWPAGLVSSDGPTATQAFLCRAAAIIECRKVFVVWEDEEEPLVCMARSVADPDVLTYHAPDDLLPIVPDSLKLVSFATTEPFSEVASIVTGHGGPAPPWQGRPISAGMLSHLGTESIASASSCTEHLDGRVFFSGVSPINAAMLPRVGLVAREIGTSLEQVRVAEQMRALAARNERTRVARDLHDGMLQAMMGVRLELQTLRRTEQFRPVVEQRLDIIDDVLTREQKDLRCLIDDTRFAHPSATEGRSLDQLLHDIATRLGAEWRTPIAIRVAPGALTLPSSMGRPLQLMVQEGIVNAVKHGHPSQVTVEVESRESHVKIAIIDDGRGFSFSGQFDHDTLVRENLGPASLRERTIALGGTISIESGRTGARVDLTLPIPASRHAKMA